MPDDLSTFASLCGVELLPWQRACLEALSRGDIKRLTLMHRPPSSQRAIIREQMEKFRSMCRTTDQVSA
ncbi:MAG TPA: hypothetical protein VGN16_09730 [Acidobacteriaceae bacterium]